MWKHWLTGALNALISGAASAIGGVTVGVGWRKALQIAAISAFVSFSKWMAQNPIPGAQNGSQNGGQLTSGSGSKSTGAKTQ